jgi:DNA-binding winged helix-turn-helix (wHTH) protein
VLELLLSRPGKVVMREELQQALWPADTFVEFDQGLNTAIKKIRLALGDSAENRRFVETIPRKGYQFIAPVERIATPNTAAKPALWRPPLWAAPVLASPLSLPQASGSFARTRTQSWRRFVFRSLPTPAMRCRRVFRRTATM